jgi:hypothetical protein
MDYKVVLEVVYRSLYPDLILYIIDRCRTIDLDRRTWADRWPTPLGISRTAATNNPAFTDVHLTQQHYWHATNPALLPARYLLLIREHYYAPDLLVESR